MACSAWGGMIRLFVLLSLALWSVLASAQTVLPSTIAFSDQLHGNFAITGNSMVTCPYPPYPPTGFGFNTRCNVARLGTNYGIQDADNENYNMRPVTADTVTAGLSNSSSADLVVPAGATVVWAGLYWHARADATLSSRNTIKFRPPGAGAYSDVTANTLQTMPPPNNGGGDRPYPAYMAYADVTSLINTTVPNGTYWAADLTVRTSTAADSYNDFQGIFGGWALLVAYELPSDPLRLLTVFNTAGQAGPNNPNDYIDLQMTGLHTPSTGAFNSYIGTILLDGDPYLKNDTVSLASGLSPEPVTSWTTLSDAMHPADNFGTSAISQWGASIARSPNFANNFGVDYALTEVPAGALDNGITSATLRLGGNDWRTSPINHNLGDNVYMQMVAFATEFELPVGGDPSTSVRVPTLSEWALLLMSLCLLMFSAYTLRRH